MYGNELPTITSASRRSIASCYGRVPTTPTEPVTYGLSSGTQSLPFVPASIVIRVTVPVGRRTRRRRRATQPGTL